MWSTPGCSLRMACRYAISNCNCKQIKGEKLTLLPRLFPRGFDSNLFLKVRLNLLYASNTACWCAAPRTTCCCRNPVYSCLKAMEDTFTELWSYSFGRSRNVPCPAALSGLLDWARLFTYRAHDT